MANTELVEAHTHKDYSEAGLYALNPQEIMGDVDPTTDGFLLRRLGETDPYASVKPARWRKPKGSPDVHENDVVQIYPRHFSKDELVVPPPPSINVGSELELLTLPAEVRNNGHEKIVPNWKAQPLIARIGQPHAPEVWDFMTEYNHLASPSASARRDEFVRYSHLFASGVDLDGDGLMFLPISSQPFVVDRSHVNDHEYVSRTVFDHLTFESVRDLGTSFQVHIETPDTDSAIASINAMRKIPHLYMALALNGAIDRHALSERLSAREQSRRKMGTAGTMPELPNWEECVQIAMGRLKNGDVPSFPRALSEHRDFRLRPDIPPGTVEVTFLDNPGSHVDKLIMLQELLRLSFWRTFIAYKNGEQLPQELFTNFPGITEDNKNKVERFGAEAKILDGRYQPTTFGRQYDTLFNWIVTGQGFSDNPEYPLATLDAEVRRSLTVPTFTDSKSSRSMMRFYETGLGTPAHYSKAYAEYLMANGSSEDQAVNDTLLDHAESYLAYTKSVQ